MRERPFFKRKALPDAVWSAAGSSGKITFSDFLKVVESYRRTMIVGDVGSGKTTFLRHLAYRLAKDESKYDFYPVFFSSRDLTSVSDLTFDHLLDWIEASTTISGIANAIAKLLEKRKVLFLLDAFDELDDDRSSALLTMMNDALEMYDDLHFVTTCRLSPKNVGLLKHTDTLLRISMPQTVTPQKRIRE